MFTTLLLPFVLLAADDSTSKERPRHPLAPSLPVLTKAESARVDAVIERFIEADTGKEKDPAKAKRAFAELNQLGPEAIFNLIESFNRAANMQASCPAVLLGKKIEMILSGTQDLELLAFAKENIGLDVQPRSRHMVVVKDLKVTCIVRRGEVMRQQAAAGRAGPNYVPATGGLKLPPAPAELTKMVQNAKPPQFKMLLADAEKRQAPQLLYILAAGSKNQDAEIQKLSQDKLFQFLQRQPADKLKTLLKHERAEVRAGAARVVGEKELRFGAELIELLRDVDTDAQQAARRALVRLSGGIDHGPEPGADSGMRETAVDLWRRWWAAQPKR